MKKRIVMVFHDAKCSGLDGLPAELGANPPMTMEGMENIYKLLPTVVSEYPYALLYCSRLARALDAASIFSMYLDKDIITMKELGQNGNKDGKNVIMYPGCEHENLVYWQDMGLQALRKIAATNWSYSLAVSHRPIIGGIVAFTKGITDTQGIAAILEDKGLTAKGYVVFEVDNQSGEVTVVS